MSCPSKSVSSSREPKSAFPWKYLIIPLLTCTEHIRGIDKMQTQERQAVHWPGIDANIVTSPPAQPMLPRDIPMAHGRRSLPTTSATRVKSTYSSAIFSASTPSYTKYPPNPPIPYLSTYRSTSHNMDHLVCFTPTMALPLHLMSSPSSYSTII